MNLQPHQICNTYSIEIFVCASEQSTIPIVGRLAAKRLAGWQPTGLQAGSLAADIWKLTDWQLPAGRRRSGQVNLPTLGWKVASKSHYLGRVREGGASHVGIRDGVGILMDIAIYSKRVLRLQMRAQGQAELRCRMMVG